MQALSDWERLAPKGYMWERGPWRHGPKENKPTYRFDSQPYGVYYIKPCRGSRGEWIRWDVTVNTYQPDARGRHWCDVGFGLTLSEAVGEAIRDRHERA